MCCTLCRKHNDPSTNPNNLWATKGVVVRDQGILSRHEESAGHVTALRQEAGKDALAKAVKKAKQVASQPISSFLEAAMSLVLMMVLNNLVNSHFASILGWAAWIGVKGLNLDKKYTNLSCPTWRALVALS
ncbi:hypothetical protein WJX84_000446 [Apatococcus fuscideae]|uniref:Uncharacterized protein n=1 Tax=Apatococcus fuscideae TaxID=2026836 RepID=A0AAW1S1X6_9CHLO